MKAVEKSRWRLLDLLLLLWVAVLYTVAVRTGFGQAVDDLAFEGRKSLHHPSRQAIGRGLDLTTVPVVVAMLAFVVAGSWRLGRRRFAVGAVVATGVAVGVARLLKEWLSRPELLEFTWAGPGNTFPSGHVAAVVAVVILSVAAAPLELLHWAVRLGAVVVGAHAVGVLVAGWHRPSDVLAAIAIGAAATGPVCDRLARRRSPPEAAPALDVMPSRREVTWAGAALTGLLLVSYVAPPSTSHSFAALLTASLLVAAIAGGLVMCGARRARPADQVRGG